MDEKLLGEQLLHELYPQMHTNEHVEWIQSRLPPYKRSQQPKEKIHEWLQVISRTHGEHEDKSVLGRIKEVYYRRYIIKPENVPDSYFEKQKRLARERGNGNIEITQDMRNSLIQTIIDNQRDSLGTWIEYLAQDTDTNYPMWAKYWAFVGMVKLSSYDKEKKAFRTRNRNTVDPFPELNREALAYAINLIMRKVERRDNDNPELEKLLKSANFGVYYAYALEKVTNTSKEDLSNTNGAWVLYKRGSDHRILMDALAGHGTTWCTATGETTARGHLDAGDFWVYYSEDSKGKATIPRVAIRMEGNHIDEIRGIAKGQNLDPYIGEIVSDKLKDFGEEGESYVKKSSDMQRLTEISRRFYMGETLSREDLRFLYQIDNIIEGFGYKDDPRIQEILEGRNVKVDLAFIFECSEDQISTTSKEALSGNIRFHYGDLDLGSIQSAEGLVLPTQIWGELFLINLQSAEGLVLPSEIGGDLDLRSLKSAEGLVLPTQIGGELFLINLQSAEGLVFPTKIGGDLFLSSLQSAEGLVLPNEIGESLDLSGLKSAKGLRLPNEIGGYLRLNSLQSAEGLVLPNEIGGDLDLRSLQSAEGLVLPTKIWGSLWLNGLQSAEELRLPNEIWGHLNLSGLKSAEGLVLPNEIRGRLYLSDLLKKNLKNNYSKF